MVDAEGLTGAGPDAHDVGPRICTVGDREGGDENKSQSVHVGRLGVQHGWSHCFTAVQAGPEGESLGKFLQTGFDFGFIQSQMAGMDEAALHPAFPHEERAFQDVAARVPEDGSVFATVERTSLSDPTGILFFEQLLCDPDVDRTLPALKRSFECETSERREWRRFPETSDL